MSTDFAHQSVITPLIKQAVKFHCYTFKYFYPNIFKISVDPNSFIHLDSTPISWKLAPWILSISLLTGCCGFGTSLFLCLLQTTNYERKPWLEWSLFNTLICLGCAFAAFSEILCCFVIYRQAVLGNGFTELIRLEQRCINSISSRPEIQTNSTTKRKQRKKLDPLGIFLTLVVILGPPCSLSFAFVGVLAQLDPFYFIFEQFILPHPYYRTIEIIVLVPIFRIFLSFFCIIEFLRFGTIAIISLSVLGYLVLSVSQKLSYVLWDQCYNFYVQLRIIQASVNSLLALLIGLLIYSGQFGTVLILWIVFKCYDLLSIYVYAAVCVLGIVFILNASVLIPTGIKVRTRTQELLRNKMCLNYCTNVYKKKKYYEWIIWKSQQCICFRCASFFILEEGLTMSYFHELVDNLVNAVLLIKPNN